MRKKKIVFHSNSCLAHTGFGRSAKYLLSYLYRTGKYDLVEYIGGGPINWSHPMCKAMPWPCFGALPDNPAELKPFENNPGALEAIKYGAFNINRVLEEQKPDVLIMSEDIWGLRYYDRPWIGKFPHVFWTPIDSLPLLPDFRQHKDKFGHLWVKARFAQEALKEQGVESKYVPDLIGSNEFTIRSDEDKREFRRKFGIADNTLIFGFVFRNQLRKLVGTLIEGFAAFKKQRPDLDTKLFLHTCWSEEQGWKIGDLADRFEVKREDILTTYVCAKCKAFSVKPFYGENMPCKDCGSEKEVKTINVAVGVEVDDLNKLYNMCDAYIHPATSGGFEMPVLEAMFSGLPVAVTDYSFGKNFTICSDVFPLFFSTYREVNSLFDKAQVNPDSILEFMQKAAEMDRKVVGARAREWAIEEFDGDKICKGIEKFIDDLPFTEYDFNFPKEESKPTIESFLDLESKKKRILYLEPGSLGDCLDSIAVLKELEKKYPESEWDYYVATIFPNMFTHLPFLKRTLEYDLILEDTLAMEGIENHKGFFDMVYNPKTLRQSVEYYKNNNF